MDSVTGNRRNHFVGLHRAAGRLRAQNSSRVPQRPQPYARSGTEAAVKNSGSALMIDETAANHLAFAVQTPAPCATFFAALASFLVG